MRPPSIDLDDTARLLRDHEDAVEAKFRASVEAERSKEDVLARKFAEGLKKAKDGPITSLCAISTSIKRVIRTLNGSVLLVFTFA